MNTLFDIEPEKPKPAPLVIELNGYALAHDVTDSARRCGQVVEPKWAIDVESFRESREAVEAYADEWGDEDSKILRVTIVATDLP